MAKIVYDIFDDYVLSNSSYVYKMRMFISNHACTYLITDGDRWMAYRSYALDCGNRALFSIRDEIEMLKNTDKMLQLSFSEVRISLLSQAFTMVPEELYSDKNPYAYLNSVCPSPASEIVRMETFTSEIRNLYLIKIDLLQFLEKSFPGVAITHFFTGMVSGIFSENRNQGTALFINFHQNQMQILVCDAQRILLANNYDFQSTGDVAYFIMLIINQLSLDPETAMVYLSGHVNSSAELYNTIARYIRNVHFRHTLFSEFPRESAFATYPLHTFADVG